MGTTTKIAVYVSTRICQRFIRAHEQVYRLVVSECQSDSGLIQCLRCATEEVQQKFGVLMDT